MCGCVRASDGQAKARGAVSHLGTFPPADVVFLIVSLSIVTSYLST